MAFITAPESKLGQHLNSTSKTTARVEWTFHTQEAEVLCGYSHASRLPHQLKQNAECLEACTLMLKSKMPWSVHPDVISVI